MAFFIKAIKYALETEEERYDAWAQEAAILKGSREQFRKLDKDWQAQVAKHRDNPDIYSVTLTREGCDGRQVEIKVDSIRALALRHESMGTEYFHEPNAMQIHNPYIKFILDHANHQAKPDKTFPPSCSVFRPKLAAAICVWPIRPISDQVINDALAEMGFPCDKRGAVDMSKVRYADYIFLPIQVKRQFYSHWVLGGVAPRQGFVFLIDPCHTQYECQREITQLQFMMRRLFPTSSPAGWPLLVPRSQDRKDRIWPTQRDGSSCGIYMLTNMMCLAFGYPLMCYDSDDIPNKRYRMAAELINNGFSAPFAYGKILIPDKFRPFKEWPRLTREEHKASGTSEEAGGEASLEKPREKDVKPSKEEEDVFSDLSDFVKSYGGFPVQFHPLYFDMKPFISKSGMPPLFDSLTSKTQLVEYCKENKLAGYSTYSKFKGDADLRWFLENDASGKTAKGRHFIELSVRDVLRGKLEPKERKAANKAPVQAERPRRVAFHTTAVMRSVTDRDSTATRTIRLGPGPTRGSECAPKTTKKAIPKTSKIRKTRPTTKQPKTK